VRIRINDFGRRRRGARRAILRSTIALAFAAAAALAASVTNANASAREISASSYGFVDSPWTNSGLERLRTQSPLGDGFRCPVNCGPAFGTYVVRRNELLTSNNVERSGKKVVDATGHAMGVGGMVVFERLEPNSFGADWLVEGERTLDSNGTHSWSLLSSGVSPDAPWLPSDLYRFEGSSLSMDFAASAPAGAGATTEASTWAMMLIGFAGLGVAAYRSSRNHQQSTTISTGASA
jgi:hypothetical protein